MPQYHAPVDEACFVLFDLLDAEAEWARMPAFEGIDRETAEAVIREGGRLAENAFAPVNASADRQGCRIESGNVVTPDGYREAFAAYAEGGWLGLSGDPEYGGQGLPKMLTVALDEIFYGANSALNLYPALTAGATMLLASHASTEQKQSLLPELYAGRWTAAMALTEPHAGSDLGIIRTRAEPLADGRYAVTGTKIFITAGDHDLADNIIHLVLARLPDAPGGSAGISLFAVPKVLADGSRNTFHAASLEEKMGIHGSPTCVMQYDGAIGELVGEPNRGLAGMFTMMNYERLSIGVQGLATAEVARQNARAYAFERLQGRAPGGPRDADAAADPIIVHPDVRRMLMTQRVWTEAGRVLAAMVGLQLDRARHGADDDARRDGAARVALLTPIVKAFLTDRGLDGCVLAQQVFGGHGYIREWGVEQFVRDVRITQIYEGTNGIQAIDLAERKVVRDGGRTAAAVIADLRASMPADGPYRERLAGSLDRLAEATDTLLAGAAADPACAGAVATEYLDLWGTVLYGWIWARMAGAADVDGRSAERRALADFWFARMQPRVDLHAAAVRAGAAPMTNAPDSAL